MRRKIVTLLNPEMCKRCQFNQPITIVEEGEQINIINCLRRDCDNWDTRNAKIQFLKVIK